jgi:hypothetical protein
MTTNNGRDAQAVREVQATGFPHDLIARPVEINKEPVEILLEKSPGSRKYFVNTGRR